MIKFITLYVELLFRISLHSVCPIHAIYSSVHVLVLLPIWWSCWIFLSFSFVAWSCWLYCHNFTCTGLQAKSQVSTAVIWVICSVRPIIQTWTYAPSFSCFPEKKIVTNYSNCHSMQPLSFACVRSGLGLFLETSPGSSNVRIYMIEVWLLSFYIHMIRWNLILQPPQN